MANTIVIKRRIGSVKNTRQITKAMQLVAASRMRKAQEAALASRAYNQMARELLTRLGRVTDISSHILFAQREIKARLMLVITSDRGLAGAYNSNALRAYTQEIQKDRDAGIKSYTICIGQKAAHFATRLRDTEVIGIYKELPDDLQAEHLDAAISSALGMFKDGTVDAVDVIYTHFFSSINQQATRLPLLPAGFTEEPVDSALRLAEFEPSPEVVLAAVGERLVQSQLWQALLESVASEHSMRMLAMKSATDNANELVDDLTLVFNNARQASITQELAEITGGVEAMK